MAPPNWCLKRRARTMRSAEPATIAPSGQPSPFEKQIVTVSAWPAIADGSTPLATAALKSRAPSRCRLRSSSRQVSAIASTSASGQTRPPAALCVFSIATIRVVGTWPRSPLRAAARTWSVVNRPATDGNGRVISPACTAGPPSSAIRMCDSSSAINSSPGSPRTRRAISFAIVAVGTKTESSWPRISAVRRSSSLTVGSSRICSSPTSAFAIASRIACVGFVAVSERRSITVSCPPWSGTGR